MNEISPEPIDENLPAREVGEAADCAAEGAAAEPADAADEPTETDAPDAEGVYHIPFSKRTFQMTRRVIDGVFAHAPLDAEGKPRSFGWIDNVFERIAREENGDPKEFSWIGNPTEKPDPAQEVRYIVEFLTHGRVRVLACIDAHAHVYTTNKPLTTLDGLEPDLLLARYDQWNTDDRQRGFAQVRMPDGSLKRAATYECRDGRYSIVGSWYDFGADATDLDLYDALTRLYLAFVMRRTIDSNALVPACGLSFVDEAFLRFPPHMALAWIVNEVETAAADPDLHPPLLARLLVSWIKAAETNNAADMRMQSFTIARRTVIPGGFGLVTAVPAPGAPFWAFLYARDIETALNRFFLIRDELGPIEACAANARTCAHANNLIYDRMVANIPFLDRTRDRTAQVSEWVGRALIARGVQAIRAPHRTLVEFRCDFQAGVVAFYARVSAACGIDPIECDVEAGAGAAGGSNAPDADADAQADEPGATTQADAQATTQAATPLSAEDFASKLGLACARVAFDASPAVQRVLWCAGYLEEATRQDVQAKMQQGGGFETAAVHSTAGYATFEREAFLADERLTQESIPARDLFADAAGQTFAPDELEDIAERAQATLAAASEPNKTRLALDAPEVVDGLLDAEAQKSLGAERIFDLRISEGALRRNAAEELACAIENVASNQDAIAHMRSVQAQSDDPAVAEALNRVMEGLVLGEFECRDKNAVVNRYLGEDPYLAALAQAQAVFNAGAQTGFAQAPGNAAAPLAAALSQAHERGAYLDTDEVVYRSFDSYAARLIYNLERSGELQLPSLVDALDFATRDAGKSVELVPDSYLMCHLEAEHLLERSFAGSDEAVFYGLRAIEIAPSTAAGYRQLARAYMLTGDTESAEAALRSALDIAVQPTDVAVAYYQLGYVLWKSGDPEAGALCYLKSMNVSSYMAAQCAAELQALVHETGVNPPMDNVDEALAAHDLPLSPNPAVLDALFDAAASATNAGMFTLARSLLATYICHKPNDVLISVLNSLADPTRAID